MRMNAIKRKASQLEHRLSLLAASEKHLREVLTNTRAGIKAAQEEIAELCNMLNQPEE